MGDPIAIDGLSEIKRLGQVLLARMTFRDEANKICE